ncbi:two-component system, OmpR family, sensor histidine kinase ResE [Thermoflexales bacterium]|nr:two-component system, OmpR family, sensor histidine kinase ResE [Thermoflexales bacterium]
MFSSLRQRLMFSHLVVILLAMGLVALTLLSFLENYFLRSTEDSLVAQARLTVQAIAPDALTAGPPVNAQAALNNAIQQQSQGNLYIQTAPPTGTLWLYGMTDLSGTLAWDANYSRFFLDAAQGRVVSTDQRHKSTDLSYLKDTALQVGAQLDTRIRVIDAQGLVVADTLNTEVGADLKSDALVTRALQGQYASRLDTTGETPTAFVAMPVLSNGQTMGVVYLSQSIRDVLTVLDDLRSRLLLSTLIALALSVFVGWWLSSRITHPVQQLNAAAEAVAEGRFDQAVQIRSRDELGRLGQTFNDMTTRLQAARQMQVDFVADVSHELRTPLTSIKGTIETLREGAVNDLEVRDRFLETVEAETDRLIRLVNDLLVLSRADSAALNLSRKPTDIGDLVRALADRLTEHARVLDLTIQVEIDPDVPPAWADADRIEQVLRNLLDNALKYSRPQGTITLRVAITEDDEVLVEVQDEGIGIPASELPRLGQRFYRADKARARGGHGLGLAIAQSLIQAHGGELWLESEEGVGTTAGFTLPIAQ